jgi:hypothetical protein
MTAPTRRADSELCCSPSRGPVAFRTPFNTIVPHRAGGVILGTGGPDVERAAGGSPRSFPPPSGVQPWIVGGFSTSRGHGTGREGFPREGGGHPPRVRLYPRPSGISDTGNLGQERRIRPRFPHRLDRSPRGTYLLGESVDWNWPGTLPACQRRLPPEALCSGAARVHHAGEVRPSKGRGFGPATPARRD